MNGRSFLLAVLIAGAALGLLGSLPVVNLVNCALCIWVWLGGALAVLIYRRLEPGEPPVTAGQGAGLGAVTGVVGALVGAMVFLVTSPISIPLMNGLWRTLQVQGDVPFRQTGFWEIVATAVGLLILDLVLYPIFGALGGLIAAALTRGRAPEGPGGMAGA